ncbi:glutaredoxin 2 [Cardiobacteriaceae bacterium TAE3-ERU3]|nr:glutaredoxin 2 [Cardiobacteriaceae bacterium TAE3-ERU3]
MKLYYYDHCPFCTRARMIFGFRNIPVDSEILANDDEETPNRLIGKKMLPILVKEDGTAMGESLDIVKYVNQLAEQPIDEDVRPALNDLLDKINKYAIYLILPRSSKIDFAEFATPSAVDYYTKKKTETVGDFDAQIARSDEYIAKLDEDLKALDALILSTDAANGKAPSMEDILIFPILRNLTTVKGINWPDGIRDYLDSISRQTAISLLFDHAI